MPRAHSTWSMRSSRRARACSSCGGTGSGAESAGEAGRDTLAAAAEHAATAADNRAFSVCSRLCSDCATQQPTQYHSTIMLELHVSTSYNGSINYFQ